MFSALINHDVSIKNKIIEASIVIIKEEKDNVFSELESRKQYILEKEVELEVYIRQKEQYISSLEEKIMRIKKTFFYNIFIKIEFFLRRI